MGDLSAFGDLDVVGALTAESAIRASTWLPHSLDAHSP